MPLPPPPTHTKAQPFSSSPYSEPDREGPRRSQKEEHLGELSRGAPGGPEQWWWEADVEHRLAYKPEERRPRSCCAMADWAPSQSSLIGAQLQLLACGYCYPGKVFRCICVGAAMICNKDNVNLNSLMNMFSGLGAGGGLGVPNAPSVPPAQRRFATQLAQAPRDGILRHTGEHPSGQLPLEMSMPQWSDSYGILCPV